MKTIINTITVICFIHCLPLVAQTNESEAEMNARLRNNSITAQEQLDKQNADKPQSTIKHLSAEKQVQASSNLTDQDKQLSENFIHQGKANRIIQEKCAGEMASVCMGGEGKHKFMGMDPSMMKVVAQAYAMFGSMGGDGFLPISKGAKADDKKTDASADKKESAPEPKDKSADSAGKDGAGKDGKGESEKANDYCKYIPAATEGIATFTQMNTTKELSTQIGNGETAQKDGLLKAAKSHDSRAKMAQVQAMGWFGGAACYGVNAGMGNFATDKNLIIKLGAAVLLGSFYQSEVSANKDYADKTRKIADSLPGKGDCNPITDKLCYCAQPETQNDPQYCLPQLHNKTIAGDSYRIACTDDRMKIDPTCTCDSRNACFDKFLEAQSQGALDFGFGSGGSPFKSIRSFARGELEGGSLNSKAFDRSSAIAKKALRELGSRVPAGPLSPAQKAVADLYVKRGLPANVAALMAQNQPSQAATNAAMSKLEGSTGGMVAVAEPGQRPSNVLDFSGGGGLGTSGEINKKNDSDDLAAKLKLGGKTNPNSKILQFAQRAQEQADKTGQIRREDDRPLFEIISLRYQLTGRKLLEVEGE